MDIELLKQIGDIRTNHMTPLTPTPRRLKMTTILAEYKNPGQPPYWMKREVNIIDGFPQAYPSTIGLGVTWTGNWKEVA